MKDVAFSLLMMITNSGKRGLRWKDFEPKVKVSSATLAKYLTFLQKQGYIEKRVMSVNPLSIKYFVTEKGKSAFVEEGKAMINKMKRTQKFLSDAVVRVSK
jgi:DNA-binding HxlR family transcriptional regulator